MYFDHPFTGLAILGALIGFLTTALVTPSGRRTLRWILVSMASMLVALCEMLVQNRDDTSIQRGGLLFCGALLFLLLGSIAIRERLLTDRRRWKQAERQRSAAEERWGLMVHKTPLAFIELDANHTVLEWNPAAVRLFGHSREEAVGKPIVELVVAPEKRPRVIEVLRRALTIEGGEHHVHQNVTRDGRVITCQWHNTRVLKPGGTEPQIYCIAHDISEATELETKLRNSQKLQSIGLLAAGVAHDFNNLLTIIQGHTDLLRTSLGGARSEMEGALEREHCESIAYASDRAAALTRQLLSFSRQQAMIPVNLDLNELVERCTRMLSRLVGANVNIRLGLAGALPLIHGDPNLIEQVITNLVVNARDAMPGGGSIRITTNPMVVTPDRQARNPSAQPGETVCLTVMDSGHGIPPDKLDRIFEPFFTTKGAGKGTGLGLAAVHGIVEQHGGWIEVRSWTGRGTIFCVFLKAVAPSVAGIVRKEIPSTPSQLVRRSTLADFTVLVVEDEDILRELCQSVLESAGCRVLLAADGHQALSQWEQHADDIDVLFTDMMMPGGLSGYDVAERLRRERADLPVVFCSGYSPETTQLNQFEGNGLIFLQKPYRQPALIQALHDALAHRSRHVPEPALPPTRPTPENVLACVPATADAMEDMSPEEEVRGPLAEFLR